ncbi:DUF4198 domain-containing protein [Aliidiomarina taiwanensis]|uniref:DUF4198 domain-containing protein n=1 Tax=Aliidiomarina taiwanensis TaxID=946228 RepID=A0A432WW45_9GAMM|nr:DUF4198 domain-containing protein [Aliidiomarina taiwanensis]RUO37994.1 DUF4198 domain-containing protein [Aliidiomarina taiwanensis]
MNKSIVLVALSSLLISAPSWAHRAWIKPDTTVVSKENSWVAFDAAISNDIFGFDHHAMSLGLLVATAPNGEHIPLQNKYTGKYRSVFDLQLNQKGTYKVASEADTLRASWTDSDGKKHYWPGRGQTVTPADFEQQVPKSADNLVVSNVYRRIETFVTAGAPSREVLQPSGHGIELIPHTHPNDLYAGETAEFSVHLNGQAVAGANIEVIPAGMRYREQQNEIKTTTSEDGLFSINWPHAGQYFMEINYSDNQGEAPASQRRASYSAVFEVL